MILHDFVYNILTWGAPFCLFVLLPAHTATSEKHAPGILKHVSSVFDYFVVFSFDCSSCNPKAVPTKAVSYHTPIPRMMGDGLGLPGRTNLDDRLEHGSPSFRDLGYLWLGCAIFSRPGHRFSYGSMDFLRFCSIVV